MSPSIRHRLYVLDLLPLLFLTGGMLTVTYNKTTHLNHQQVEVTAMHDMMCHKRVWSEYVAVAFYQSFILGITYYALHRKYQLISDAIPLFFS
ncbi:TPA: hypothetical protein ACGGR4_003431 [Vibrio cholerae]